MEYLIGIDESLPDWVIGCDPGPAHCAVVAVKRDGGSLSVEAAEYPKWEELVETGKPFFGLSGVIPFQGDFAFAYEKVTSRYGACPGETTYATCRNSGIILASAIRCGASAAYGLGTVDWRVALGGRTNLKDSETRAELTRVFGKSGDDMMGARARKLKDEYGLDKPIGCHLRDAAGVAVGAFLMKRHGTPVSAREVWHA